jgi:RND family efflux transporter MFP subunit
MSSSKRFSWKGWLLLAVVVLAVVLGVVRALGKRQAQQAAAGQAAAALQQPPAYQLSGQDTAAATRWPLQRVVPVSGALKALNTVAVKAKVAGELQGLAKREGETVKVGEVVARIDSTEAEARVRQADQQAQSALAQVRVARRAQENNQALVGQGFISPTALDTTSANLAAAEANHQAAQAALDIARKALADTTLRAPMTGQVSARLVQNGERVALDTRVLELVDLSAFEVEVALAPADAALVRVGQPVTLQVEGLAQPVSGRVARSNPTVQVGSRNVLVYVQVAAVPGLRQGLFAQGQVVVGQLDAVAVPVSAVRNDKPQPYLQVVQNGAVRHWPLKTLGQGQHQGQTMVALDGLPEGTPVLRAEAGLVRDGTAVRLPQ